MPGDEGSAQPRHERQHHEADEPVSCLNQIGYFYNAPVIAFWNHVLLYAAFLILFLYTIIWSDVEFGIQNNPFEIVMIVWVFAFFIDEIRRVYSTLLYCTSIRPFFECNNVL